MFDLLLYNVFLNAYYLGIKIAALKNKKAENWLKGRANIFSEVETSLCTADKSARRIWMHVSSLGEFEQGRPLIEKIKANHPQYIIIITFFSPSGYELRKNYELADFVFYLPLDGKENAGKFIHLLKPDLAIFVKYEFWYYYFKSLKDNNIPLVMLSAIFRQDQPFFKWYGTLHKKMLKMVTHFFVQDEISVKLLARQEIKNITQIPDTRIDRVWNVRQNVQPIKVIENFLQSNKAFLGGSIYEAENEFLTNAYHEGKIPGKLILAPHNIQESNVEKLMAKWGDMAIRFTKIKGEIPVEKDVLIVDTIGMLNHLYQYAYMVIIGGGFGKSIHNILEPAAFGVPVLFGPIHHKFKEAKDLLASGGAFEINNQGEFDAIVTKLYNDSEAYKKSAHANRDFIEANIGGTEKVYIWLREKMLL
ncbi:MAG: 3-deoxy-D-manno-octulosonic acid transferase [Bacteroidia bacterium]